MPCHVLWILTGGNWTTSRYDNSRTANLWTSQSTTDQVWDWTARRLVKSRPVNSRTSVLLWFFGDSRSWVATHYCRNWSVVRWSWSSWNVWHSGTNEWKDETSQMPAGHSNQQWYEDRRSSCKDGFEKTIHKMCRHQLNGCA